MALALLALAGCASGPGARPAVGPIGACRFDPVALQFDGDALAQARCLLRAPAPGGRLGDAAADLPAPLATLIGRDAGGLAPRLQAYLDRQGIAAAQVGGALDRPLSRAHDNDPAAPMARYFVIHDTSTPYLGDAPAFPPDTDARVNDLDPFAGPDAVAHVFIARDGHAMTGHDYGVPWRATRIESRFIGLPAKGLFVHNEFMQPRRRDPAGPPGNDVLAPWPGFTDAQYRQMALLYACASARRGQWLIPAFHAALDEGLVPDAHDDPQHFEMAKFNAALAQLLAALTGR